MSEITFKDVNRGGDTISQSEISKHLKDEMDFGSMMTEADYEKVQESLPDAGLPEWSDLAGDSKTVKTSLVAESMYDSLNTDGEKGVTKEEWEEGGGSLPEPEGAPFEWNEDKHGSRLNGKEAAEETFKNYDAGSTMSEEEFDEAGLEEILGRGFDDINTSGEVISKSELGKAFTEQFEEEYDSKTIDEEQFNELYG